MCDFDFETDYEEDVLVEDIPETKKPKMYKVLLHNDNYTSMEFVTFVLKTVFHKSYVESFNIMMGIHTKGVGVAGIYTLEVAKTNVYLVEQLAEENEYPLKASIEEV